MVAQTVAAGDQHACAISDGGLWCWGANANGELGTVELGDRSLARRVGTGTDWKFVAAGETSTCGLRAGGQVWCWGKNSYGEVGRGDFQVQLTPRQVTLSLPAQYVTVYGHTCVILQDASLWCWGFNTEGQLGQNDGFPGVNATAPLEVLAGSTWKSVSAGQGHTCGVKVDGSLYCWGRNSNNHCGLGLGAPGQTRTPQRVDASNDWRSVACHQEGCCALKNDRSLWCWGSSAQAEVGTRSDAEPTRVGIDTDWTAVDAETFFTCGLKASGAVWCWGRNLEGMLGTGGFDDRYVPGEVGDAGAAQVVSGRFFRCVRDLGGAVRCNGKNEHGQAGAGDFEPRPEPARVLLETAP